MKGLQGDWERGWGVLIATFKFDKNFSKEEMFSALAACVTQG